MLLEAFQTEDDIKRICKEYEIEDLSIDVYQDIYLFDKGLTKLPLTFNRVIGNFYCNRNRLTSLKGSPRSCKKFWCNRNNLTSLEFAPDYCDEFHCDDNYELKSLEFIPRTPYVSVFRTKVASLKYLPNICTIHRNYILDYILELIGEYKGYKRYRVTNIDLFNEYGIIDDNDYISGLKDKPSISLDRLKHFMEDVEINKEIDVNRLSEYYEIS